MLVPSTEQIGCKCLILCIIYMQNPVKGWLALGVGNSIWVIYLMFSSKPGEKTHQTRQFFYHKNIEKIINL